VTHAEQFIRFISAPGDIRELRLFTPRGTWAGTFDDPERMARNALGAQRHHGATAAYFTLNPIRPGEATSICARQLNRIAMRPWRTTRDPQVSHRAIYLIDVDPVRPSGVSSTDEEKAAAFEVVSHVRAYLTKMGWPQPIFVDSGNGYHLLFRGEGYNAYSADWCYTLKALAAQFNTPGAKVDTSVYNPSRISRLPGTWNRKGDDSPERPHRLAHAVFYPDSFEVLPDHMIYNLATMANDTSNFDDEDSLLSGQAPGIDCPAGRSEPEGRQALWQASGLDRVSYYDRTRRQSFNSRELLLHEAGVRQLIEEFPEQLTLFGESHDGPITFFALTACPFVGRPHRDQLVGRGKTTLMLRPDSIGFSCFSDECHDRSFSDLLRLLHQQTGRRPSMKIWGEPDLEPMIKRWGGVIDVAQSEDD